MLTPTLSKQEVSRHYPGHSTDPPDTTLSQPHSLNLQPPPAAVSVVADTEHTDTMIDQTMLHAEAMCHSADKVARRGHKPVDLRNSGQIRH